MMDRDKNRQKLTDIEYRARPDQDCSDPFEQIIIELRKKLEELPSSLFAAQRHQGGLTEFKRD